MRLELEHATLASNACLSYLFANNACLSYLFASNACLSYLFASNVLATCLQVMHVCSHARVRRACEHALVHEARRRYLAEVVLIKALLTTLAFLVHF